MGKKLHQETAYVLLGYILFFDKAFFPKKAFCHRSVLPAIDTYSEVTMLLMLSINTPSAKKVGIRATTVAVVPLRFACVACA